MICFLLLLPLEVNKTGISRTPVPVDSISHKTCIVCPSGNTCSYWPIYHFVNICHTLSWVNIITVNIVVPQTLSSIIYVPMNNLCLVSHILLYLDIHCLYSCLAIFWDNVFAMLYDIWSLTLRFDQLTNGRAVYRS